VEISVTIITIKYIYMNTLKKPSLKELGDGPVGKRTCHKSTFLQACTAINGNWVKDLTIKPQISKDNVQVNPHGLSEF